MKFEAVFLALFSTASVTNNKNPKPFKVCSNSGGDWVGLKCINCPPKNSICSNFEKCLENDQLCVITTSEIKDKRCEVRQLQKKEGTCRILEANFNLNNP